MTNPFTRHLDAIMRGPMGCAVTFGSQSVRGILDDNADILNDGSGDVLQQTKTLMLRKGTLSGVVMGSVITVRRVFDDAAITYEVRTPALPAEDGAMIRYGLAVVS